MNRSLYYWITTPIIWGIWLYLVIKGIRTYIRTSQVKGMPRFMTRKELAVLQDPDVIAAVKKWKSTSRKLFLLWVLTALGFVILSAIINSCIGFKD